jgi:hypothetical protein
MSYAETLWGEGLSATFEDVARDSLLKMGIDEEDAEKYAPWAAMAPEFLPFVGAGVGIDNIGRATADGRYMDAAKEFGLMMLGEALPVVGDIAVKKIRGSDNLWGDPTISNITAKEAAEQAHVPEARRSTEDERLKGPVGATGNYTNFTPKRRAAMEETSAGQTREALAREGNYETVVEDTFDLTQIPTLTSKELEGAVIMPMKGDRTAAGTLLQASGVPFREALDLQSGPMYMLRSAMNEAQNAGWESTDVIARSFQDKVQRVAEDAGTDNIWGAYHPMSMGSADFSTMPVEAVLREMDAVRLAGGTYDPKLVAKIDDKVRNKVVETEMPDGTIKKEQPFKDFPGIESPDAEEYLSARGMQDARKAVTNEMNMAIYKDAGFPNVQQVLRDVAAPELHRVGVGEKGHMLVKLDPNANVDTNSVHRSYGTRIPIAQGDEVVGRLSGGMAHEELSRDEWADLVDQLTNPKPTKSNPNPTPRLLNSNEKMNTIADSKPGTGGRVKGYQSVDDRLMQSLFDLGFILD